MKFNLSFVKIGIICGAGVLSILTTSNRLQAQNNPPTVKEVSLNKNTLTSQYLTQVNLQEQIIKARQAEARNNVGAMNRYQQAYFLDYQRFTSELKDLQIGIKPETENYFYEIKMLSPTLLQNLAIPKIEGLKSYTGIVYLVNQQSNEALTLAIVCESQQPSKTAPPPPLMRENEPQCPAGFDKI